MKINEYAKSGFPGLDDVLDSLRTGDNVVWQIRRIEEYIPFIQPFCRECASRNVPLVYFRFARHRPLVGPDQGAEIHRINPDVGFERFVSKIIDVIDEKGEGACYIFDCLSDLAVDWYSDQMLSNFFMITCPYLYKLATIAFFSVDYSYHTKRAIDSITGTAQVIIRVHENQNKLYIQPLKATTRYSPTMFMLHEQTETGFQPATSSTTLSEILSTLPKPSLDFRVQQAGIWTRTFMHAQETLTAVNSGKLTYWEAKDCFKRLLRMIATRDDRVIQVAEKYFDLSDLLDIMHRMIGTGLIGGKTLGMLLARGILRKTDPRWADRLETHDSFFVGSDVFYTYLVHNDCWWLRRELCNFPDRAHELAHEASTRILNGKFPDYVQAQFMEMLDYFGQSPIIVRSSSLLEDNYGNAFSGKYESVFCPNQLPPEERLEAFLNAVRKVYASALNAEALEYRAHRGLLDRDEQMALLVQRVSGDLYNGRFFPQIAGVGFSFNPYVWDKAIDPHAGFLRLVMGLGTRAVDRLEDDYTRMVALNAPLKRLENNIDQIRKYSQHHVDVLDLASNTHMPLPLQEVADTFDKFAFDLCTTVDADLIERARAHNVKDIFPHIITFDKLITGTSFVEDFRQMLKTLHEAYDYPVDIEFTVNFDKTGNYRINLLQCRPFQANIDTDALAVAFPEHMDSSKILFSSKGPIIGPSSVLTIERLIYVDPTAYSRLTEQQRYGLARVIGSLNKLYAGSTSDQLIIGPGRWGTSSPSLGIPVRFSEISSSSVICELAAMHEGLIPDVSLGSHFFNDLVEFGMLYIAIMPHNENHDINSDLILSLPNSLKDLMPDAAEWENALHVVDSDKCGHIIQLHADSLEQRAILYLAK